MVTVTHRLGKLVTVRIASPVTYREATLLKPRMEAVIGRLTGPLYLAADLADARVYSPDVAEKIIGALQGPWATVRRQSVVINSGSALGGQVYGLFREMRDPERQAWVSAKDMGTYLAEVLGPAEAQALRDFMAEQELMAAAG